MNKDDIEISIRNYISNKKHISDLVIDSIAQSDVSGYWKVVAHGYLDDGCDDPLFLYYEVRDADGNVFPVHSM